MIDVKRARILCVLVPAAAMAGCGGSSDGAGAQVTENPTTEQGGRAAAAASFDAADLDAYQRGLRAEIAAVTAARERGAAARTPEERGAAAQDEWETATIPIGAQAAGMNAERYEQIRETVHGVLSTLDFQEKIDGPLSMDLERADAATRERLSRDPFADLPSDSAAALRAKMDEILPAWIEYVTLTAVAG
jgi:hypothetical protein